MAEICVCFMKLFLISLLCNLIPNNALLPDVARQFSSDRNEYNRLAKASGPNNMPNKVHLKRLLIRVKIVDNQAVNYLLGRIYLDFHYVLLVSLFTDCLYLIDTLAVLAQGKGGGGPVQIKWGGTFLYTPLYYDLSAHSIKRNNAFH